MVILVLAMVIRIVMTIASEKMVVFGWSENGHFRHRHLLGERTDKVQKTETASPNAKRAEMNIYTLSEKTLQQQAVKSIHRAKHAGATTEHPPPPLFSPRCPLYPSISHKAPGRDDPRALYRGYT